ncbi:MAG: hypothetical protein US60_C0015G0024 [Microgenomates group bacterium GW2011_GWC1_37_8]|uniref:Uncharacterized protein n=1 Tax=Candidatus Woesebacteria bacterium GW2011_GWB1_38_8 TaxID=1618570 RepID=A0A0G0NJH2_9BACT|nr:MAG: hypothetical protein US60_C0015G0024 [Microgenomates group bacterium GW2011_GWC1_37_8]KKQ86064.1 MAG: hypothetical protein UT08_C0002G0086 [Candidatus Woesebacteria bacterium GW2011_GWB1_38_8]
MAKAKNELTLDFLSLCDYAVISRENKLSILGIFDQIFVNSLPSQHPKMFLVGILKGEPASTHNLQLLLKDPLDKDVLPNQELKVKLGTNGNSNFIAELNNLPIKLTGAYKIELFVDKKLLAKKEFNVFRTTGAPAKEGGEKLTN